MAKKKAKANLNFGSPMGSAKTSGQGADGRSEDVAQLAAEASHALEALMEPSQPAAPTAKAPSTPDEDADLIAQALQNPAEDSESGPAEDIEASSESEIETATEASEDELAEFGSTNIFTEEEPESFLPEADEQTLDASGLPEVESVEGTELDAFESAQIEELEFVEDERLDSILESIFFASDRPVSLNSLKLVFKGTNVKSDKLKRALDRFAIELASGTRGVSLEEVPGGYQLRTKIDNLQFLTRTLKARQFKLSGPALEVLAIVAYKQPLIKHEIDEIRGVESGHLLRALMEKGLVNFEGKSDLPGKPMQYATTKKFLEIFGLRNLKELPTLSQIDELLPEGMTEEEAKPTLSQVTDAMSQTIGSSYSESEEELTKITDQLGSINSSSDFFEQEKLRQRQKRDEEKAQNIREAMALDETVSTRDRNWLTRYDEALATGTLDQFTRDEAGFGPKATKKSAPAESPDEAAMLADEPPSASAGPSSADELTLTADEAATGLDLDFVEAGVDESEAEKQEDEPTGEASGEAHSI